MGDWISGVASGGANLVGSLIGIRQASYAAHLQEEQNELNREFNREEAEKQRVWSTNERLAMQGYNTSERLASQAYNSPVMQVQRLRQAGINPSVYFSGNSTQGMASPQSAPSVPVGTPASFHQGAVPVVPQIPQLMSGFADLINAFSKSRESKASASLMSEQARLVIEQVIGQKTANDLADLERSFHRSTLNPRIKKALLEVAKLRGECALMEKQGKVFESEERLNNAKVSVEHELKKLKGTEALSAQFYYSKIEDIFKQESALRKSQTTKNLAEGENARSNASLVRYTESVERALEANKIDMAISEANKAFNDELISQEQVKAAEAAAEIAKVNASHAEANFWKDYILEIISGGVNAFAEVKNALSWKRLSDAEKKRVELRAKDIEKKYSPRSSTSASWKWQNGRKVWTSGVDTRTSVR